MVSFVDMTETASGLMTGWNFECFQGNILCLADLNVTMTAYNSDGDRICTDILVSGYIREANQAMDVPPEIIHLCFIFWFIDICDSWDKSTSHPEAIINGQCIKARADGHCTFYGCHVTESESYEWRLKCKQDIPTLVIGLIEDEDEILKCNQESYSFKMEGNGCCLSATGSFFYSSDWQKDIDHYCERDFATAGTIITLTLDMDKKSVSYKINNEDYGFVNAEFVKENQQYRLAVYMKNINGDEEIELL